MEGMEENLLHTENQSEKAEGSVESYAERLRAAKGAYDDALESYIESKELEETSEFKQAEYLLKNASDKGDVEMLQALIHRTLPDMMKSNSEIKEARDAYSEARSALKEALRKNSIDEEQKAKFEELTEIVLPHDHPSIKVLREEYMDQLTKFNRF